MLNNKGYKIQKLFEKLCEPVDFLFYFLSQSAFDSTLILKVKMFYKLSVDNFTTTISIKLL